MYVRGRDPATQMPEPHRRLVRYILQLGHGGSWRRTLSPLARIHHQGT